MDIKLLTVSATETEAVGASLAALLRRGDTVLLMGDLGAGKTTFVKGLAAALNVSSPASSPTFALISHLHGPLPLIHMDAYRLNSSSDLYELGFYDLPVESSVLLVEWADRVLDGLPETRITVEIASPSCRPDERSITIGATTPELNARIGRLSEQVCLD